MSDSTTEGAHLRFGGWHLLSSDALARRDRLEAERLRRENEAWRIREMETLDRMRREIEAMKLAAESECRRMRAECRRSIREQYEVFDRQWSRREAMSQARVEALRREFDEASAELDADGGRGRKLLALAVDLRTPEAEAVAAFLKARAGGIRIVE